MFNEKLHVHNASVIITELGSTHIFLESDNNYLPGVRGVSGICHMEYRLSKSLVIFIRHNLL